MKPIGKVFQLSLLNPLLAFFFFVCNGLNIEMIHLLLLRVARIRTSYLLAMVFHLSSSLLLLSLRLSSVFTVLSPYYCDFKVMLDYIHKLPTATHTPEPWVD